MGTKSKSTSKKPAVKSAPRKEGKVIPESEHSATLVEYLEHWRKFGGKKKGANRETEIDAMLDAAKGDLSAAELKLLKEAIAPDRIKKEIKREMREERKAHPRQTRAEYRQSKFKEAEQKGEWYPGHKHCKVCKQTDRKHYSGGQCTRCYTKARDARLIAQGLKEDPEVKRKEREAKRLEKEQAKQAKAEERARKLNEERQKKAEAALKKEQAAKKEKAKLAKAPTNPKASSKSKPKTQAKKAS